MMRGRRQWHSFGVSFLALVQSAGSVPEITAHVNANSPPLLHLDDGRPHAGNRPHVREADQSDRFPVDTSTGASFTSSRRTEQNNGDDDGNNANALCSEFLFDFLEGTTSAEDSCDGLKNAYTAAGCSDAKSYQQDDDNDDYFVDFSSHACCAILKDHYSEYCRSDFEFSNLHLLSAMIVLLIAECAKNAIHRIKYVNFIPEAGICILVGMLGGAVAHLIPNNTIDDMSFDSDLFMSVLLPPIIFDAALSVSKTQFKRRRTAIACFAILGTLVSTGGTGAIVYYASHFTEEAFPVLDSLVFGALISSIDPIAILSILSSLGLTQGDTVYILVLGESLLNDGVAVTVFKTLVGRLDGQTNDGSTSVSEVLGIIADFIINMVGSVSIALVCGILAWLFFYLLKKTLTPAMEVGSVFIWALVPFYVSEAFNWSGIVSLVVMGCFVDIYIASPKEYKGGVPPEVTTGLYNANERIGDYVNMDGQSVTQSIAPSITPIRGTRRMRLSPEAKKHVRFFAHVTAQLAENAIFAYLGLFLFSKKYDWDPASISIGILSCLASRAIMVVFMSYFVILIYKMRGYSSKPEASGRDSLSSVADNDELFNMESMCTTMWTPETTTYMSRTAAALRNPKTQAVLWLAGLRGAVSLSLVENIPMHNALTGGGCQNKALLKAMTSATIIFTTFALGGASYFLLPLLGFGPDLKDSDEAAPEKDDDIELSSRKPPGLEGFQVDTDNAHRQLKTCVSELSAEPSPSRPQNFL